MIKRYRNFISLFHLLLFLKGYSMEEKCVHENKLYSVKNLYDEAVLHDWLSINENPRSIERMKEWSIADSFELIQDPSNPKESSATIETLRTADTCLVAAQYACLAHIKNLVAKGQAHTFMSLFSVNNSFAVKVSLASGDNGLIILHDLAVERLEESKKKITKELNFLEKPNVKMLFFEGSPYKFLDNNFDLVNKVDVLYIEECEHTMNPLAHQAFIKKLVLKLLKPGGHVFASARTIESRDRQPHNQYFTLYKSYKNKGVLYPLFAEIQKGLCLKSESGLVDINKTVIFSATRPTNEDHDRCGYDLICMSYKYGCFIPIQYLITNRFTPKIYKNAYGDAFECVESFYMDAFGRALKKHHDSSETLYAAYIGKKKS